MLVIVGEFNSGKSSFLNALLGKKYLKEGVTPTTNKISIFHNSHTYFFLPLFSSSLCK
jgi:ribosome biogenesis GTPase A